MVEKSKVGVLAVLLVMLLWVVFIGLPLQPSDISSPMPGRVHPRVTFSPITH